MKARAMTTHSIELSCFKTVSERKSMFEHVSYSPKVIVIRWEEHRGSHAILRSGHGAKESGTICRHVV